MWKCRENCGECCGVVPIPKTTWEDNKHLAKRVVEVREFDKLMAVITTDMLCCFLGDDKKCLIYNQRPEICRIYGMIPDLACPYVRCNGTSRIPEEVKLVQSFINKSVDKTLEKLKPELVKL